VTTVVSRSLVLAAVLCGVVLQRSTVAYVIDSGKNVPISYFTFVPPAAGETYLDPAFGTSIRRISNALNTRNAADTGPLALIGNEYATMSPFNIDNSRLLLTHQSYFALYDGDGRYLNDLPFEITAASEPRWSRHAANVLYYVTGNRLKQYDTASGIVSLVHAFTEYAVIGGGGESDICFDGDHFVLVGDYRDLFVYDIRAGTKGLVLSTPAPGSFDNVFITPDDNVLVSWYANGAERYQGVELFDRDMHFLRQISRVIGHMDVTRDVSGQEAVLMSNAADSNASPVCSNAVVKIRLADAVQTCVVALEWGLGVHISATDASGWAIVSTYAAGDPNPLLWWPKYASEILQVKLDGSEVRRLAHHRSRPFNTYGWTPRASVSRDGGRVVYSSNYGLSANPSYPRDYSDAYLIDLSSTAPALAGSSARVALRVEQNTAASIATSGTWYSNSVPHHSGGSAMLTTAPGARMTFTFAGTGVRWIGYRDEWSGMANVYIDGRLEAVADTFAPVSQTQQTIFSKTGLTSGTHTLTVEPAGQRNAQSGGYWVWVDAFEVVNRIEQDDAAVQHVCTADGGWYTHAHPMHSASGALLSMSPGCSLRFTFTGTAVSWLGYRDEWSGMARVSVDGALRAEIDTYTSPSQPQTVIYTITGLSPADHTLTIEPIARWNPNAVGRWIWIDAFETLP
jgi:hypothetical protein